MDVSVTQVPLEEVLPMRDLYRREMNCQIVGDSLPRRGFGPLFILRADGRTAGYGFVMGYQGEPKDMVREFYVLPRFRGSALRLFRALVEASGARRVESQSNDTLLTLMLYDCASQITSHVIVFQDGQTTNLAVPGATFRAATEGERENLFEHHVEPVGEWLIEYEGAVVATGGVLVHYNPPYGDLFMEVHEPFRRKGLGSFLIQELKRVSYERGRVPAARCNVTNVASRATLEKAGLVPCARMLSGVLAGATADD
jgi:GNAT superfamily N-acetyltransferase